MRFIRNGFLSLALLFLSVASAHAQLYGWLAPTSPSNPAGTTSLTGVALGLGVSSCQVPIQKTGAALLIVNFSASNGTAGDGFAGQIAYGPAATAPANGAAIPASWSVVGILTGSSNSATVQENQTIVAAVRGLPLNAITGFDLKFEAVTGGTATAINVVCQAFELPN